MLEPTILGNHNRRDPRNRLEFACPNRPESGDQMKAKLALGMVLGLATGADKSATILTQTK